jgi:hypothetical protein
MAEDKGAGPKGGAKDSSKDGAAAAATQRTPEQEATAFALSLSPEARAVYLRAIANAGITTGPAKPIVKKKFRVVATRLGFDGLTLRHPGRKFSMDININDDWPDWVVKEEDYVPPPKDEDLEEEEGAAQRVQIRGGVKAGNSVIL